jgi:hypothetical protein
VQYQAHAPRRKNQKCHSHKVIHTPGARQPLFSLRRMRRCLVASGSDRQGDCQDILIGSRPGVNSRRTGEFRQFNFDLETGMFIKTFAALLTLSIPSIIPMSTLARESNGSTTPTQVQDFNESQRAAIFQEIKAFANAQISVRDV